MNIRVSLWIVILILSAIIGGSAMSQESGSGGRAYVAATFGQGQATSEFSTSLAPLEDANDDDRGLFAAATVGLDQGLFRFELEYSNRSNEGATGLLSPCPGCEHSVTVHALMINSLIDFPLGVSPATVSAGAGLGVAGVMHDLMGTKATDSFTPAAQAIVQMSYAISDGVEIFGDARYFRTLNEAPVSDSFEFSAYSSQSIGLGIRYTF